MLEKNYGNFGAETGEDPVVLSCLGFQNQKEQMDNQCNPDLRLYGVLALPVEAFDAEVLFYHFEEKLHLPAFFINGGDFQGVRAEHVCQE